MFFPKKEDFLASAPSVFPLLPLRDVVVFPSMIVPLFVDRERSVRALESAMKSDKMIFLASQKNAQQTNPAEEDIFEVGTLGHINQMLKLPDKTIKVFVEGRQRGKMRHFVETERSFKVEIDFLKDQVVENDSELRALIRGLKTVFETYASQEKDLTPEFVSEVRSLIDIGRLADHRGWSTPTNATG